MIPFNTCEDNDLVPFAIEEGRGKDVIVVAIANPMNLAVIDEIEFTTGLKVRPVLATISAINSAIRKYYRGMNTTIKPMSLFKKSSRDTGRMVLVRPGGQAEEVDTSTRQSSGQTGSTPEQDPGKIRSKVEKIKARRAQQVAQSGRKISSEEAREDYLKEVQVVEVETLHKQEKYFWALMRVMAKKGIISKEEFLKELDK